jgi:diguanylate cyclase (GGDEF)-like protein
MNFSKNMPDKKQGKKFFDNISFLNKISVFILSLKTKLIISFLIITVIPLLHTSWITMKNATEGLKNVIVNNSLAHSKKAAKDITFFISSQKQLLKELSDFIQKSIDTPKSENTSILDFIRNEFIRRDSQNFQIENIFLHELKGKTILSASKEKFMASNFDIIDKTSKEYKNFLKGSQLLSSSIFTNQDGIYKTSLSIIIKNIFNNNISNDGKIILSIVINTFELSSLLSENIAGETTKIFLFNNYNEIVAFHPENSNLSNSETNMVSSILSKSSHGVFSINKTASDKSYLLIKIPVIGFNWKILMIQSQSEVYSLVMLFRKNLIWVLALTTIASIFIALIISQNIALPIIKVTKIANDFAAGKLDARINLNRNDEAGQLANSFNFMAGSLKNKIIELENAYTALQSHSKIIENTNKKLDQKVFETTTLYEISQNISLLGSNIDKIYEVVLEKYINATDACRASLMMLNDNDEFEVKKIVTKDNENNSFITIEHNSNVLLTSSAGIAGKVIESGKVYISENVAEDSNFQPYSNIEINVPNKLICVPLKAKNIVFGVINISNPEIKNAFDEKFVDFMVAMASQISMAIDNARLFNLAITDGLTGLYMVRHFKNRMEEEIKRARRYHGIFSILFMDIDHFKIFNDTYGHQQGDIVLKGFADLMRECVRTDIDIPARYGGEEFIILLPETDIKGAFKCAERLRILVETHKFPGQQEYLHVTTSIGIAEYPKHSENLMELIKKADTALYFAKEHGRNRVSIYTDEMDVVSEK